MRRYAASPSSPAPSCRAITEVLEVSPLPFGMEPVLRRLRGLPTFYVSPFDLSFEDDRIVEAGEVLSVDDGTALIAAVFPDALSLAPWSWLQLVGDALAAASDPAAADWMAQLSSLYGSARRCRVLDHVGRPLAADPDPGVSKAFTVRLREASNDGLVAERSVTLGGDSDLESALAASPGVPSSIVAPAGQYVEVAWRSAPVGSDSPAPIVAVYETRDAAAPADENVPARALRLPAALRLTLQVLDLSRWYPPVAPETAIARYRAGSQVTPLVDGIASFERIAADLRNATGPGDGAYFAGWTFNRFALDPTVSDDDMVDLVKAIHDAGPDRVVRVLSTKFINLRNPDLPKTRKLAMLLLLIRGEAYHYEAMLEAAGGAGNIDGRGHMAFWVGELLAAALIEIAAAAGDFQWLLEAVGESAKSTVEDLNAVAPGLAVFSVNPHRIADNPLADTLAEPLVRLEDDSTSSTSGTTSRRWSGAGLPTARRMVGYLGGIDVNKNRFDSPGHGIGEPVPRRPRARDRPGRRATCSCRSRSGGRSIEPVRSGGPNRSPRRSMARCRSCARAATSRASAARITGPNPPSAPLSIRDARRPRRSTTPCSPRWPRRATYIYIEEQYFTADDAFVEVLLAARRALPAPADRHPGETDQPFGDNRRRDAARRLTDLASDGWGDRMRVGLPAAAADAARQRPVSASAGARPRRDCSPSDDTIFVVALPARVLNAPFWLWVDGELMLARDDRSRSSRTAQYGRPRRGRARRAPRRSPAGAPRARRTARARRSRCRRCVGIFVHAKA